MREGIAQMIAEKKLPEFLYKYQSLYHWSASDKSNVFNPNLIAAIEESYLWFSIPGTFNDPNDGRIGVKDSSTDEEFISYASRSAEKYAPELSEEARKEMVANLLKLRKEGKLDFSKGLKDIYPNYGICCLCEFPTNTLMWAHYANESKGICIKYDVLKMCHGRMLPFKVEYTDLYPEYEYIKEESDAEKMFSTLVCTKSKAWEYECEWRMFLRWKGKMPIIRDSIAEIIFGSSCDSEMANRFKTIVLAKGHNPVFTQAKLKTGSFGLEFFSFP